MEATLEPSGILRLASFQLVLQGSVTFFAVLQTQCEDQADFSTEGEQGGHGCAGVHPCQRWICHAGHR